MELNEANGYQTVFSTAAADWVPDPDSDYRLRWLVGKSADVDTNSKDLLVVSYENLRTGKPHITLERTGGSFSSQRHKISLGEADVAVLKEYDYEVTLYRYIRQKGEQTYTKSSLNYVLGAGNNYSDTLSFELLKEDTEYEFSVGNESGEKIYATDVFRTPKDNRSVVVTRTEIHVEDAVLYYALTGFDRYSMDYVKCYYRRAGFNEEWKQINAYPATKDGSFTVSVLEEATDYEYLIGIASKLSDDVPFLTHTVRGTVTTRTDTRRLEVDVTASMTSAQLICRMFDMEVASYNHVAYFFREKGQEQWEILEDKGYYTNEEVETIRLEGLKENTVYEYRVGFEKTRDPDPAELKHVAEGEFRTAADLRNVEITVEPKTFSAGIYYTLSHMEDADDGYLLGYLRKASETEEASWEKVYSARTGHQDAEDVFVIGELEEETSYELTMGFGESDDAARDSLKHLKSIMKYV